MRSLPLVVLSLSACSLTEPSAPGAIERPEVAVVRSLQPGHRLRTELPTVTHEEAWHRAAAVWWREALRQSATFEIVDGPGQRKDDVLELTLDPDGGRLATFLRLADGSRVALAGGTYLQGRLAAGIDRIAWATRLALGEDAVEPLAVAACTSASPRATDAANDAYILLRDGGFESARRAFLSARRLDGGSPFVLDGLASAALLRGEPAEAERLCREALTYENRLTDRRRLRLIRTLLLAGAGLQPRSAPEFDRQLRSLAEESLLTRPHDSEGTLTLAIAENFLGEFARSLPLLDRLAERLPNDAVVSYHLGWARLGTDDPSGACRAFEHAALRLPRVWTVIPRTIALYDAGNHEGLERMLAALIKDLDPREFALRHELHRMLAAHALLRGDRETTAEQILADLNWLVAHPALLDRRPAELAAEGEVLVRLGYGDRLPPLLAAIQSQRPGSAVADCCAYVSGFVEIAERKERTTTLEQRLSHGGESAFSLRLQAFAHEVRGERADCHIALSRAARLDDSALTKALLARSLRLTGRGEQGKSLRQALRRELTQIHLRRQPSHPILGPELAFAYLLE